MRVRRFQSSNKKTTLVSESAIGKYQHACAKKRPLKQHATSAQWSRYSVTMPERARVNSGMAAGRPDSLRISHESDTINLQHARLPQAATRRQSAGGGECCGGDSA